MYETFLSLVECRDVVTLIQSQTHLARGGCGVGLAVGAVGSSA